MGGERERQGGWRREGEGRKVGKEGREKREREREREKGERGMCMLSNSVCLFQQQ